MQGHVFASPHPHAELQAIEAIEPPDSLAIDRPALPPQQHPDPHVAKPWPGMREIPDAEPQRVLIFGATGSIPRGPSELRQATGPRTAHRKRPMKPLGQFPAAGGP